MTTFETKDRSAAVDAVRVLGMTAIVAGHVWWNDTARLLLFSWHVPVFFVLSGYLASSRRPLSAEIVSRTRSLLVPYVTWFVLLAVIMWPTVITPSAGSMADSANGGALLNAPMTAFWFATALFFAAVVMRLIAPLPLLAQWGVAAVGVALAYLPNAADLPLGVGEASAALVFLVAGRTLAVFRDRIGHPGRVGGLLAAAAVIALLVGADPVDIKPLNLGTPVVSVLVAIALSIAMILLAERWVDRLPAPVRDVIMRLGRVTLVVMFVHYALLFAIGHPGDQQPQTFLFALIGAWTIALLVPRLPWAHLLTGQRTRRPAAARTMPAYAAAA